MPLGDSSGGIILRDLSYNITCTCNCRLKEDIDFCCRILITSLDSSFHDFTPIYEKILRKFVSGLESFNLVLLLFKAAVFTFRK